MPEIKTSFLDISPDKMGAPDTVKYATEFEKGLSVEVVKRISEIKSEPEWMLNNRLKAFEHFLKRPMPTWGPNLSAVDFSEIVYFRSSGKNSNNWKDVPEQIKNTFERLGIPEAERKFLAGAGAQFESESIYHKIRDDLAKLGVIFCDMDTALKLYPDLVKKYFGTVVPYNDNKFAALNTAVWSGGSFVFVPKGVHVDLPLQAYFRINAERTGQFERTLIIVEEGASVHYLEACSAPVYADHSLHAAVVEVIALPGSRVRYTTLQNWATNVFNLVTKRAHAHAGAYVEWVDANTGCLCEGTKIFANPEVKTIENIAPNDKIFAYDEATQSLVLRKVLATKFSGVKPTYKVVLGKGKREVIATSNHPFLKLCRDGSRPSKLGRYWFDWVLLQNIKQGDWLLVPSEIPDTGKPHKLQSVNYERNALYRNQYGAAYKVETSYKYNNFKSPELTNEDIMWLLGVYVGDGSADFSKTKTGASRYGRVTFSVPSSDKIRDRIISIVREIFGLDKYTERKDKVCITYNSLLFAEWTKLNGFSGNAHTKELPAWIFSLPKSQKLAFIAGYLEADGYIGKGKGSVRIKSCNKKLVEDIRDLALTCGLTVNKIIEGRERKSIKIGRQNSPEKEYIHYVTFVSNLSELKNFLVEFNRKKIEDASGRTGYIRKGRAKVIKNLPSHLGVLSVTSIEPCGEKPTYDLEIEGAHNFVANGIFVHNSAITMKYPSVFLIGEGARADILSVAFANSNQIQDTGAKAIHAAPNTSSTILSKSVSKGSGFTNFRGLVEIYKGARNSKSHMKCDALVLDPESRSDTIPTLKIDEKEVQCGHEAVVGKVSEDQLFYLMSRGLTEDQATTMIVSGFLQAFTKSLPLEYAIEFNRLIELEMTGSVG